MKILITGASGLLGLNLALETSQQHTVYGVVNDHLIHSDAFTVIQADLLAPGAVEQILEQTQPDWVIHCAALANVDACEARPALAQQLNSELPRQLAHLCAARRYVTRGGARLVHISTDCVFDGARGDYTEEDAPNPLGVYAHSKLQGEIAVQEADPEAIIARVNLFGWSISGKRSLAEFFFNNLSAGKQVMGFTDVLFCPLLANDLAHVLVSMLEKGLRGVYHVVGSQSTSKFDFGVQVARRFGLDASLIIPTSVALAGLKAARSPNLTLRTDKLARALGQPIPNFSTGLDRFYTLYQQGYPQMLRGLEQRS
ncbi:MAG: SDR family oxidoreductase [Anaerolineales bacterium]|nr:SDR family oxidoreductase [Anaerolineales bacterium]